MDLENQKRVKELLEIAQVCRKVPANNPETLHEAIQMYWFVHLGTVIELNGWDAMNPGHLDQHLYPFYQREVEGGTLHRDKAKELLECLWIKFNNQTAPPKVGVTALESGTYNDFTNINIGGLQRNGSDGVNELSFLLLEVIDEIHLLQPGCNIQVSHKTPDAFLKVTRGTAPSENFQIPVFKLKKAERDGSVCSSKTAFFRWFHRLGRFLVFSPVF